MVEQLFHAPPQKREQGDYAPPEHAFLEQVEEPVRRRRRWGTRSPRRSHGCTVGDRGAVLARARDDDVALAARRAQGEFRRTVLARKTAGENPSTSAPLGIAQAGAQHRVIRAVSTQARSWALRVLFAGILQGSGQLAHSLCLQRRIMEEGLLVRPAVATFPRRRGQDKACPR